MKYLEIEGIAKPLSRIAYGCDCRPMHDGDRGFLPFLDYLYDELGITLFDDAWHYRDSETILGEWMEKRGNRDKVAVISKGCCLGPNKRHITKELLQKELDESLLRLKTSCIDIYYLHRDDPSFAAEELIEMLNDLRKQGKVNLIGVSNWRVDRIEKANKYAEEHGLEKIRFSSPSFSLARQVIDPWRGGAGCICLSRDEEALDYYKKTQIAVAPYSAMARGFLAGRYPSEKRFAIWKSIDWASRIAYFHRENFKVLKKAELLAAKKNCTVSQINLAFLFHQEFPTFPVLGSTSKERMAKNAEALSIELSDEEMKWLNDPKD
ncbi:MAG: aldo/keto reductase [Bacilli bacterium]|nr:aldo/keto reductase [Bacilli bacterium]